MTRLSNEELDAIRERCEKATPGPWLLGNNWKLSHAEWYGVCDAIGNDVGVDTLNKANADFIANAREDIPKLVEALLQERAEVEPLRDAQKTLTVLCVRILINHIETLDHYVPGWRIYVKKETEALRELLGDD